MHHKNFVRFFGVSFDSKLVIVTEFIEGSTLDSLIRRGLEPDEILEIAKQLAEGMRYLHSNAGKKPPIIHKDLKPANVIITTAGKTVKIIDLGISALTKLQDGIQQIKTTVQNKKGGTFLYKAPEHFYEETVWLVPPATDV